MMKWNPTKDNTSNPQHFLYLICNNILFGCYSTLVIGFQPFRNKTFNETTETIKQFNSTAPRKKKIGETFYKSHLMEIECAFFVVLFVWNSTKQILFKLL